MSLEIQSKNLKLWLHFKMWSIHQFLATSATSSEASFIIFTYVCNSQPYPLIVLVIAYMITIKGRSLNALRLFKKTMENKWE